MGNDFTAETESDLNTYTKEGPVQYGAEPDLDPSSFPSFLSEVDKEPNLQPTVAERKSAAILSLPENSCQPHPPRPSRIKMTPFRPPIPKADASKNQQALLPPLQSIKTFDPSLNDLIRS
jgi:hypothetical protein